MTVVTTKEVGFCVVWGVYRGGITEGASSFWSNESRATEAAKGAGEWGANGTVRTSPAVKIDGKVYILAKPGAIDLDLQERRADEELRKRLMEKLTPEEKRVLGLL